MHFSSLRTTFFAACLALGLGALLLSAAPSPRSTSHPASHPASRPTSKASTSRPSRPYAFLQKIPVPPASIGSIKSTVLVYTGGLKSYFEPCGCQADMLGGLARVSSLLSGYRRKGLQLLHVDAGNLFFENLKVNKAKKTQNNLKAEMVADLLRGMGTRLTGVGPYDLTFGLKKLKALLRRGGMTALSANLVYADNQKPVFPGRTIVRVGGKRIGFLALLDSPVIRSGTSAAERKKQEALSQAFWKSRKLKVAPALAAARREVAALKKAKVDLIVLLSTLGSSRLQKLVTKVKGIHIAIEGAEESAFDPPQRVGETFLLSTPKEGQKLGVFAMYLRSQSTEWSAVETPAKRKEALAAMKKQIKVYHKQAKQMRKQGKAFAPIAKVYEKQAADLQKQIVARQKTLAAPPSLAAGRRGFFHLMLPVSSKLPDFPKAAQRVARYQKEVVAANLKALKSIKPILKDKHGNYYKGVETCKTCHMGAYNFWKKTRHANAYATLVKRKKQFDLDCIGCHVVGWQEPGGLYDIKNPHRLANVQCENCHSLGGLHADRGGQKKYIHRNVTAAVCVKCHKGSHDPNFNFAAKLKKILGKGHGEKRLAELLKKGK